MREFKAKTIPKTWKERTLIEKLFFWRKAEKLVMDEVMNKLLERGDYVMVFIAPKEKYDLRLL